MSQRKHRFFSPEFKAQAVDLVHQSGKGVKQIAQDLDVTETYPFSQLCPEPVFLLSRAG